MITNDSVRPGTFCTALTTLRAASRIMVESGRGALPVYFDGRPAGTVAEGDIRALVAEKGPEAWELVVWDALARKALPAVRTEAA